jgi:F-box and WD-40 domain protein 1/11
MRIVSGSNDNTVRIFDHVSGAQVACLKGHSNLVRTVQAGFGDPPGSEEALRLEALAVDQDFWDAQRSGQAVDLGPAAMRRAGYRQNTAGSRDPRDINAVGALIPPGGGGSKWGKIVSGSYDESVIIWRKDSNGEWVVSQTLRQADAAARAAHIAQTNTPSRSGPLRGNAFAQLAALAAQARPAPPQPLLSAPVSNTASNHQGNPSNPEPLNTGQNPPQNDESPVLPNYANFMNLVATNLHLRPPAQSPTSRIFKLQFDARKIVCASQDPRIVVWDFVGDDEELNEACQFFTGL